LTAIPDPAVLARALAVHLLLINYTISRVGILPMASLLWFIAFLLLLGLEMVLPGGFYFACLALGALAAALAALLGAGSAWTLAVFFGVTLLGVAFAAPMARRWMRRIPGRPVGFDALPGQRARVTEDLDPATGKGRVQLATGVSWLAVSEAPIPANAWVEVVAVTGTRLRVHPLPDPATE
jgi:membrane protein implicated in regulation of membrane protease activity